MSGSGSHDVEPVDTARFVAAMGQHVSSVCVITACHEGQRYGLTATAVSSVCASPPRLLVCVNKSGISHEKMIASNSFCVNVLSEAQDTVAKSFAGMLGKGHDRFSVGAWHTLATGAPVLVGAAASFDCRIAEVIDQFSHSILIGEVIGVATGQGHDALLYGARRFRTLRKTTTSPEDAALESLHF
jgi:flavin reductase (DIM6/NTAB) family NADH-FMN oxidoreductase RutF